MAWSTEQLARLANTTANTVRHYHKVGLLDHPERTANGYKRYGVPHLLRLLQIKRLSELGFSLAQVAEMGRTGPDSAQDAAEEIRVLDDELAATMERLARTRSELAQILEHGAAADTPTGFAPVSGHLSESQRSMLAVYSTVFNESSLKDLSDAVAVQDDIDVEFENLEADSDDVAVESLAARMVLAVRRSRDEHPDLSDAVSQSPHGAREAKTTIARAIAEVYNRAQLRVLKRLGELMNDTRE
jgi:DNA-binding transcriptional MerR regulator